jgi:hypothetical protein
MLALVIALSILGLIFLVAATMELVVRRFINFLSKWRAGQAAAGPFESEDHFGRIVERNQIPTH